MKRDFDVVCEMYGMIVIHRDLELVKLRDVWMTYELMI